ncbi:hypothetical protein [Dactylosporangium sp. CA-139066]|uniref:hypothetical protein n=1 Tax=Dactylosporangium sp. CA-139066 TaxID=3239930 RepID=UPI003D9503AE
MRDWIAVIITVLGVLLVLAGGALIVLQAVGDRRPPAPAPEPAPSFEADYGTDAAAAAPAPRPASAPVADRILGAVKSPSPADRLIFWGIILLVLAAIAAGAISFDFGAKGGS